MLGFAFSAAKVAAALEAETTATEASKATAGEQENGTDCPLQPWLQQEGDPFFSQLVHHLQAHFAVFIVDTPFGRIREDAVRIIDLLELLV